MVLVSAFIGAALPLVGLAVKKAIGRSLEKRGLQLHINPIRTLVVCTLLGGSAGAGVLFFSMGQTLSAPINQVPLDVGTAVPTLTFAATMTSTPLLSPTPTPAPTADSTDTAVPTETPAPTATRVPTGTAVKTAVTRFYIVQAGDTLTSIARNNGTTIETIAKLNGLDSRNPIVTGQRLILP